MSSCSNLFIDETDKLVVKASCDLEHDMIAVSNDILLEEEGSLEETPLEEPSNKEIVDIMPRDMELVDPISIEYLPWPIPTSIIMPSTLLFHASMDPSISTLLELDICMIDALI